MNYARKDRRATDKPLYVQRGKLLKSDTFHTQGKNHAPKHQNQHIRVSFGTRNLATPSSHQFGSAMANKRVTVQRRK